jgi:hypothetical protein
MRAKLPGMINIIAPMEIAKAAYVKMRVTSSSLTAILFDILAMETKHV